MQVLRGLRPWTVGTVIAAAAFALPTLATAQAPRARSRAEAPPSRIDAGGDPATRDFDLAAARRANGFRLYGSGDLAVAGMHGVGNLGTFVSPQGPGEYGNGQLGSIHTVFGTAYLPTGWGFQFFEQIFIAAAGVSDYDRARQANPSLSNAKGGGYSHMANYTQFTGRQDWGPADGTLGSLFSGVLSTEDGTCRDNSNGANGFLQTGVPLLAMSNCPDTWASTGFDGTFNIPQESWVTLYATQGGNFRFDFHRVPLGLRDQTKFLGSFSTYAKGSDHYRDVLASYGAVTRFGSGTPAVEGWPLGLDVATRGYTFTLPTVASVVFYEVLVINRSADVYAAGIDYDSLYFGHEVGTGGSTGGGGQRFSNYYDAARSTAIYHQSGVQGSLYCAQPARIPAGGLGCGGVPSTSTAGFGYRNAGNAIVVLKSPYGDLRNKLFTRAGSPFYNPAHPAAGDTITFNHGHICGFGGCAASTLFVNDRRSFGLISSTEANVLDGRTTGSLSTAEAWRTFRNRGYPTTRGIFNRWVPGGFDYNHDGIQDTLFYDTCGGATPAEMALGCVTIDADTMPSGHLNAYGNVGGVLGVGPFPLAAGDTAVFMYAMVGDNDSASFFASINAAIDFYQNFYLGPEPPPVPDIVSTQLTPAAVGRSPTLSLFFSDAPERYTDPFLTKFATDLQNAAPGTELYRVGQLNPGLVAQVQARAADNLEQLMIFKSCDGGDTFTSDGDCVGDPAVDDAGTSVGTGWQAYAILNRADYANGDLPNVFTDRSVVGGKTYLYVIVGKSRGATFLVSDSIDTDGNGSLDALGGREFEVAAPLTNPLSRSASDPNVASVYLPASRQSGSAASRVTMQADPGLSTVPFSVSTGDSVLAGQYSAVFGNRVTVIETRVTGPPSRLISTVVTVEDTVMADSAGQVLRRVVASTVDTSFNALGVPYAGTPSVTTATIVDTVRTTYTFASTLGFAVFAGTEPLFVSTTLTGTSATPAAFFSRSDFPGFIISADNRDAGKFADEATVGAQGDTLNQANVVDVYMVQWRQERAVSPASYGGGRYVVTWLSDPFGLGSGGLTINETNPSVTEAELAAALGSRPTGLTAATDASTAAFLGVSASALVAARLPFTITNTITGKPVTVAMRTRANNTILLGSALDTIRVTVATTEWIPGDRIILIDSVLRDSTAASGGVQLNGATPGTGTPIQVYRRVVAFDSTVLGCNTPRDNCNPVQALTPGQTGYVPLAAGTRTQFNYWAGFNRNSLLSFDVSAPVRGTAITSVTGAQLDSVRVVPNPFVIFSQYQSSMLEPRVLFTHMPPSGILRIYTVSGQFVQQITWTAADLSGSGDLFYNLRTREGTDMASGLYIWVLTTTTPDAGTQTARGKFVVIRGQNN